MGTWCTKGYFNQISGINDPSYHFRQFRDNYYEPSDRERYCMYLVHTSTGEESTTLQHSYGLRFGEIGSEKLLDTLQCNYSTFFESIQSDASEPHEPVEITTYQNYNKTVTNLLIGSSTIQQYVLTSDFISNIPIFEADDLTGITNYVKNGKLDSIYKGVQVTVVIDTKNSNFEVGLKNIGEPPRTESTLIDEVNLTIVSESTGGTLALKYNNMNNVNSYSIQNLFISNINVEDIDNNHVHVNANFNYKNHGVALSEVKHGESKSGEVEEMPVVLLYSGTDESLDGDTDNKDSEDNTPLPTDNDTISAYSVLTTTYKGSKEDFASLGNWLWNLDLETLGYKHVNDNPIENIVNIVALPFDQSSDKMGNDKAIRLGNIESSVNMKVVSDTIYYAYYDIIVEKPIGELRDFLNHGGYTKCTLYSPFFNLIDLSTEDVIGYKLRLNYYIDVSVGEITLEVISSKRNNMVVYQGTQKCSIDVPLFATNRASKEQAVVTAMDENKIQALQTYGSLFGNAINSMATRNAGGLVGAMVNTWVSEMQMDMNLKQAEMIGFSTSQKGSISGVSSLSCYSYPYVILSYPNYVEGNDYQLRKGRPVMKTLKVGQLQDFIKFDKSLKIVATTDEQKELLHNANLTNEFKKMIYEHLTSGVYYTP